MVFGRREEEAPMTFQQVSLSRMEPLQPSTLDTEARMYLYCEQGPLDRQHTPRSASLLDGQQMSHA